MTIVLDLFYPSDESVFCTSNHTTNFGLSWVPLLNALAAEKHISLKLATDYLNEGIFSANDLIISEEYTNQTKKLIKSGARPFLIFCGESPNVSWTFYYFITHYTKKYTYSRLFGGCSGYVAKTTNFRPFLWPNNSSLISKPPGLWQKSPNRSIIMIAGNKKQASLSGGNSLFIFLKKIILASLTRIKGPLKLKDLYAFRMKAILYFAGNPNFSLYGRNWDNKKILTKPEQRAVAILNPQKITDKYELLCRSQFALCFENCEYPGYITEKIFDCFFCGCIPIYKGAPDIEIYIPSDLFIDMRKFDSFELLEQYIETLDDTDIKNFQLKINNYLQTDQFQKFTDQAFARDIVGLIECQ